ncbi:MAG: exodeoxyribonuclease V subunit beta [Desulfobulbaceae bacterium]|jgi:exodeoxyribonuclease V beta subunit|nr:exodeoxyribonuclease V subunit beta [Desulfobulbaceae bacterium]
MIGHNFDVAREHLTTGVNLIEAGAGSGKTFAIAMLVLRAVAELFIPLEKILVVTFTRAATEELRERVRHRLRQAQSALAYEEGNYDDILIAWRDNLENIEKSRAAIRLALRDIDRAEISSIHGFCQKTLAEHALACGEPPDNELADEKECRREIAEDFWRQSVYPLPAWIASVATRKYADPQALAMSIAVALDGDGAIRPDNDSLDESCQELEAARAAFGLWWRQRAKGLLAALEKAISAGYFKKEFSEKWHEGRQCLTDFANGMDAWPEQFFPWLTESGLFGLINGQKMRGDQKKADFLATLKPLADAPVDNLTRASSRFLLALRLNLAIFMRRETATRLRREGQVSFNELTRRLAHAACADHNDGAQRNLTSELRERYRMALIDEFQDTDIWQWRIFARLFATGEHYLYLIGDPKQAIYRFRGADIFSYFQAAKAANRHLSLTKNFRSHPLLTAEINRLFSGRSRPFFFSEEQIAFQPAEAARAEADGSLWRNGEPLPVCRYRLARLKTGEKSQEKIAATLRDDCLRQIIDLLDPNKPVVYKYQNNGQEINRLITADDIAVLTRTNAEAEAMAQALAEVGVAASLDSRVSIFSSQECQDLLAILTAVAAPGDAASLRLSLACDWFGLNGVELATLFSEENEDMLAARLERWYGYQRTWLAEGAESAIHSLLSGEAVYRYLRVLPRFERRIANILHLTELLAVLENERGAGIGECLEWLAARRNEGSGEEYELRLESDRKSVRILTMHGVKGLEFPIVFCPSLWRGAMERKNPAQVTCHDAGQTVVDLGSPRFDEALRLAAAEEHAEELRLLYVTLTRAKLQYVVFWPLFADDALAAPRSPFCYLLASEEEEPTGATMRRLFLARSQEKTGVTAEEAERSDTPIPTRNEEEGQDAAARVFHGQFDRSWQVASFSSLARRGDDAPDNEPDQLSDLPSNSEAHQAPGESTAKIALPSLPKGRRFGNLIHACLDMMDFAAPPEHIQTLARQQSTLFGLEDRAEDVAELLGEIVTTSLPSIDSQGGRSDDGWRLADLQAGEFMKEMPWSFAMRKIKPEEISAILADEEAASPVSGLPISGYLTGFIDLFCRYRNKYYILDYKTNFLGGCQADYRRQALVQAMAEHNYGLQYWLYTLAAHRWLAWQQRDYNYERDFAGVYYLFVRGMRHDRPGAGVFATKPDLAKLERLTDLLGERR